MPAHLAVRSPSRPYAWPGSYHHHQHDLDYADFPLFWNWSTVLPPSRQIAAEPSGALQRSPIGHECLGCQEIRVFHLGGPEQRRLSALIRATVVRGVTLQK